MDNNYTDIKKYVEDYYNGVLGAEQKKQFEEKIVSDPVFAEEVAFYLSTITAAKELQQEETRQRFREIYKQQPAINNTGTRNIKNLYRYVVSAAAIIILGLSGYFIFFQSTGTVELARAYINSDLLTLGQKMGQVDTMQTAIQYYNSGRYDSALYLFESINKNDPDYSEALKNAGLAYLEEKKYDEALERFSLLISINGLYSKQGIFLKAVTLMARNKPGDKQQAKVLLQQVAQGKTEGYEQAEEWLKKF